MNEVEGTVTAMAAPDQKKVSTSLPTSPEALYGRLRDLEIPYESHEHAPVFTVEESKALPVQLPGAHIKNLFLRNKKGRMWLVVCQEDRKIDLKALGERLGAGRLSFGSPARLMDHLGVLPGSVTPLAIVNDIQGLVQVVLDRSLLDHEVVNCHPLVNHMTTVLKVSDLQRFLALEDHPPELLSFDDGAFSAGNRSTRPPAKKSQ
ncbi:MAG: prolyl-tRNA synthetase associated domain-containing protein [Pseudomonadota bacterium]